MLSLLVSVNSHNVEEANGKEVNEHKLSTDKYALCSYVVASIISLQGLHTCAHQFVNGKKLAGRQGCARDFPPGALEADKGPERKVWGVPLIRVG